MCPKYSLSLVNNWLHIAIYICFTWSTGTTHHLQTFYRQIRGQVWKSICILFFIITHEYIFHGFCWCSHPVDEYLRCPALITSSAVVYDSDNHHNIWTLLGSQSHLHTPQDSEHMWTVQVRCFLPQLGSSLPSNHLKIQKIVLCLSTIEESRR